MKVPHIFVLFLLFTPNNLHTRTVLGHKKKPNIVLITVNQLSLGDLYKYWKYLDGIQDLSKDAIQFSHAYSQLYPSSSRAALLTGRLPVKTGILKGRFLPFTSLPSVAASGGLPLTEQTLAEFLRSNGYTSKFIGLWDQGLGRKGQFLPLNQGFSSWFGVVAQHSKACSNSQQQPQETYTYMDEALSLILYGMCWSLFVVASLWCLSFLKTKFISVFIIVGVILYVANNRTMYIVKRSCVVYKDSYIVGQPYNVENITLRFTDEALGFMKTVAHPFFLMVNHLALSKPLFTSPFFRNVSGQCDMFLDSLVELDWSVKSILRMLEHMNLTNNTIVVFTALSGGINLNGNTSCNCSSGIEIRQEGCHSNYLRGDHSVPDNWERQIKVPLFAKWPNMTHRGKTINQTVTLMDIVPTILALTNTSYSNNGTLNGRSLIGLLEGTAETLHPFVFHYLDVTRPSAVTHDKYKVFYSTVSEQGVVHHDPPLLFNIRDDPEETSPLPVEENTELIATISEAREKHVENRTRKWISQFEYPILPWLFPCANFPYCQRRDVFKLKHILFNGSILINQRQRNIP